MQHGLHLDLASRSWKPLCGERERERERERGREREREREGRREDRGLSYGDYVMKRVRKVDIYIKREMKQINNHTRKEMEKEKKVKACLASV
jgi:hypothetical protein